MVAKSCTTLAGWMLETRKKWDQPRSTTYQLDLFVFFSSSTVAALTIRQGIQLLMVSIPLIAGKLGGWFTVTLKLIAGFVKL